MPRFYYQALSVYWDAFVQWKIHGVVCLLVDFCADIWIVQIFNLIYNLLSLDVANFVWAGGDSEGRYFDLEWNFHLLDFLYLCRGLKKDKRTCGSSSKKIASLNESKQEQASVIYKWGSVAGMASLFYPKSTRGKTAGQSSSCHLIVDFLPWFAS